MASAKDIGGSGVTSSPSRARLSLVLLLYFLGIIGVITLAPFRFTAPVHVEILGVGGWFDVVANVLLFVPLGFLYPLTRAADDEPSPGRVFLLGLLLSAGIEATQLFEPERVTSFVDVLTNAAGAGAGALIVRTITRRVRTNARLVGRLSLENVAAGWMVLGTFPVLLRYPLIGIALVAVVGLMTWYESSRSVAGNAADRRFEAEALRSAAQYVAVYFVAIVLLPLAAGIGGWRLELGLTGRRTI